MAKREGYEVTDEWLEQINEELRKKDVSHKRRPWNAWMEWSKYVGVSTSLGDEDVKQIFEWFEKNTKGALNILAQCMWDRFIMIHASGLL